MNILTQLNRKRLFFDGSMGTMLQSNGLEAGGLPETWNITHGETIYNIHKAYVDAGCDIIKTNTFGATRLKLAETGYTVDQTVSAAVSHAKKAAGKNSYVALSIGPTGKLLAPLGDLGFEEAVGIFTETIFAGVKAGVDLILIETMSDTYELKAAMIAAKESCDLPIFVTFTLNESGRLLTGGDILSAVCLIEALGANALGLNCGLGAAQMKEFLTEIFKAASIPIIVNPNAGMPKLINGKTIFQDTPDEFAFHMSEIAPFAQIIGGCCGTTPHHITEMINKCSGLPFSPAVDKNFTAVSSYGKAVVFGGKTIIIGERINPTGKSRMKQALKDNDMNYIQREGLTQIAHGADILDVNVGMPGIDEPAVLTTAMLALQSVTDVPLQIDTADPAAVEKALRLYNGKPLLNSVNGKIESLETILPLVKKYGAAVVALALDDYGIPETAEKRFDVIKEIVIVAKKYGIKEKDILVDALTMTVSTGSENANTTLKVMGRVRRELGLHTVLGVSNVSFGLPERELINAAFFTVAMSHGLSAGIINPLNAKMMDAFYSHNTLSGLDENCAAFISRFSDTPRKEAMEEKNRKKTTSPMGLIDAIINGLSKQAGESAVVLLKQLSPIDIINEYLIPALDKTGDDFEKGIIFLPQLLMSAEAAKSAFESIKQHLANNGAKQEKRGKIVLATVKGDVHDIGKNIVKVLLENYNFEVIDLGKNVEPALVAATAAAENAGLVGLSALMTTTVSAMEETILILRKIAPNCRVMVGGAVLTEDYAVKIGADFYAKDAMRGVRFAEKIFAQQQN